MAENDTLQKQTGNLEKVIAAKNNKEDTVLHSSAANKECQSITLFMTCDLPSAAKLENIIIRNNEGRNVMHILVKKGRTDKVEVVLNNLDADDKIQLLFSQDNSKNTPYHYLPELEDGNDMVETMMKGTSKEHLAEVLRSVNQDGETVLTKVVKSKNVEALTVLMNALTDTLRFKLLSQEHNDRNTFLHLVAMNGTKEMVDCIALQDKHWLSLLELKNNADHKPTDITANVEVQEQLMSRMRKVHQIRTNSSTGIYALP